MATKVIFRRDGDEIVAVFPRMPGTTDPATMTCYVHMGQHGACTKDWYYKTRPTYFEQDSSAGNPTWDLFRELVRQGYDDMHVMQRITQPDDLERERLVRR